MSTRASFAGCVLTDPVLVTLVLDWLKIKVAPLLFGDFERRRVPLAWWAALRKVNRTFNAVLMRLQKDGAPMIWSCWLQYVDPPPSVCTGGIRYPSPPRDATNRVNAWLEDTQLKLDVSQMESFVAFADAFMSNSGFWDKTTVGGRLKDQVVAIIAKSTYSLFENGSESVVNPYFFTPTIDVVDALDSLESSWLFKGKPGKSAAEYAMWCDTTKASLELIKKYAAIVTNSHFTHNCFAEDILKGMKKRTAKFKYGKTHSSVSDIDYVYEFYAQRIFCEVTYAFAAAVICKWCPKSAAEFDAHFETCVEKIDLQSWLDTYVYDQDVYVDQWFTKVEQCLQPVLGPSKFNFEAYELGCIYEVENN